MSWSYRPSGRRYLRRNYRDGSGKVRTRYVGSGPPAEGLAEIQAAERAVRRHHRTLERCRLADLAADETPHALLFAEARAETHAALHAAGFHQHHRGEWRKRKPMSDPTPIPLAMPAPADGPAGNIDPDLARLRDAIAAERDRRARFHECEGDLHEILARVLIGKITGPGEAEQAVVRARYDRLRADLAGEGPPPIVALLADRVALAWLEVAHRSQEVLRDDGRSVKLLDLKSKLAERAHRRLLGTIKLLLTARRKGSGARDEPPAGAGFPGFGDAFARLLGGIA